MSHFQLHMPWKGAHRVFYSLAPGILVNDECQSEVMPSCLLLLAGLFSLASNTTVTTKEVVVEMSLRVGMSLLCLSPLVVHFLTASRDS